MPNEMKKVRHRLTPANSNGDITTMPSGTFCKAIPTVTAQALSNSSALKPTPTAIPSGNLWMAIAITKRSTWLIDALWLWCSCSSPVRLWR